ncbi:MAG: glycoside hydrolase family 3 N-terminal domain-containing protein [Pseudomonadota bacterium]
MIRPLRITLALIATCALLAAGGAKAPTYATETPEQTVAPALALAEDSSDRSALVSGDGPRGSLTEPPLRQMIGQMIMVGFSGTRVSSPGVRDTIRHLEDGKIGGVLYLGDNISSLPAVREMNDAFQRAAGSIPPFIAVDQEGGFVQRLNADINFPSTPSAERITGLGLSEAEQRYLRMAENLKAAGFNLNLGPVLDVKTNPQNPIIARFRRSYSSDPDVVAQYAGAFIRAHRKAGVLTAVKHFPGHGSSRGDTHLGFTDITETWDEIELEPYRQLLRSDTGLDMVMTGHLYHSDLNAGGRDRTPATLSPQIMRKLRAAETEGLNYRGVVITDDMRMAAIRKHFSTREALIDAVLACNDVLMYSAVGEDHTDLPDWIIATLEDAAQRDPRLQRHIRQSYARIIGLKQKIGATVAAPTPEPCQPTQSRHAFATGLPEVPPLPPLRDGEEATVDAVPIDEQQRQLTPDGPENPDLEESLAAPNANQVRDGSAEDVGDRADGLVLPNVTNELSPSLGLDGRRAQNPDDGHAANRIEDLIYCANLDRDAGQGGLTLQPGQTHDPGRSLIRSPIVYQAMRNCLRYWNEAAPDR